MEESVYSNIPRTKHKTLKVRDLEVSESVYSSITRDKDRGRVYSNIPGTNDKTFKVRDLWRKSLCTATKLETKTKHSR